MLEIGRVCIKTAGRDSGQIAVIIDLMDNKYVLVDGNVKRRKCNIKHLEPLPQTINIDKDVSTEVVKNELASLGFKVLEKKQKPKEESETQTQKIDKKSSKKKNEEK